MVGHGRWDLAALMASVMMAAAANAQTVQRSEVLGDWTLRMTAAEGEQSRVTIETDNGQLDLALTVSPRGASGIACTIDEEAADCRIHRGELVVSQRMDSARMTCSLSSQSGRGFSGSARLRLPCCRSAASASVRST